MCENCREDQDKLLAEITELASGEGETFEAMKTHVYKTHENEELREHVLRGVVAKAITLRAAMVAMLTDSELTEEGGMPVSFILGMWAGWAMEVEIDEQLKARRQMTFENFFGMGRN